MGINTQFNHSSPPLNLNVTREDQDSCLIQGLTPAPASRPTSCTAALTYQGCKGGGLDGWRLDGRWRGGLRCDCMTAPSPAAQNRPRLAIAAPPWQACRVKTADITPQEAGKPYCEVRLRLGKYALILTRPQEGLSGKKKKKRKKSQHLSDDGAFQRTPKRTQVIER